MKTLYLLEPKVELTVDGNALRIDRESKAPMYVPLTRVGRAVVRAPEDGFMKACIAILERGGTVHLQDGSGHLCAIVQQPWADGPDWVQDLALTIEHQSGNGAYYDWRDTQQRHAWSLIARQNFQGDFDRNRDLLMRYIAYYRPDVDIQTEGKWLEQQLLAWIQAQFSLQGLHPVMRAISSKGERLDRDLLPCLWLPLLWRYVRWRRTRKNAIVSERVHFFELQAAAILRDQFERHINALSVFYADSWQAPWRSRNRQVRSLFRT